VLRVTDAREIARISDIEKYAMLETFAEGFFLASAELASGKATGREKSSDEKHDPSQPELDL
jgi:hypothetical protein